MRAKSIFGGAAKVLIAAIVMMFLALHTINFFKYTFPPEQSYYAYLGFGLTGVGMIVYLILFMWDAHTPLKKVVSLAMIVVCGLGEIVVATFGMQIEAWAKNGWVMTETDFNSMMLAIEILAFAHFTALVLYIAGDKIATTFSNDEDKDGIADWMDKTDNRTGQPFPRGIPRSYNSDTEQVERDNGHRTADPTNQSRR